jgi:hypothetical protein
MTQRTLLEEIKRIHEIAGIKSEVLAEGLINEAADPISKEMSRIIASFFTGIEKEIIVGAKKYTQKQVEKIVSKIGSKTLTADEISVVKTLTKEAIAADRAIVTKLTMDIFGEMQKLNSRALKTKYFGEVKAALKNILPDEEVKVIVKDVTAKNKAAVTGSSSNTNTPPKKEPVLTPDPDAANASTKPLKIDELPPNSSDIINATAKSSTEAAAFMQQVDLLGFNDQITTLLKLGYAQNYKKSPAELVEVGNDLARMLNEKTYGPVKRLWARFASNPSGAIEKTGRAGKSLLIWVTVLSLLSSGVIIAFAFRDKIMKSLGLEDESLLPDVGVPDLGKKDDSNKQTSGIDDTPQGLRNFFKESYEGYDDAAANALDVKSLGSGKYEVTKDGKKLTFIYSNGTFTLQ